MFENNILNQCGSCFVLLNGVCFGTVRNAYFSLTAIWLHAQCNKPIHVLVCGKQLVCWKTLAYVE